MTRPRRSAPRRPAGRTAVAALAVAVLAVATLAAVIGVGGLSAADSTAVAEAAVRAPRAAHAAAADEPWTAAPVGVFGGVMQDLAVDEARQLVWGGQGRHVVAIDISRPSEPRLVGRSPTLDANISAVAVDGTIGVASLGLFTSGFTETVVTMDLSDPATPRVVGRVALDGPSTSGGQMVLADGTAYVVHSSPIGGFRSRRKVVAIDVRDPANPRILNDDLAAAASEIFDLQRVGRVLAVTSREPASPPNSGPEPLRLHLLDVADPAHPRRAATVDDPAWYQLGTGPGANRGTILYGYGKAGGVVALDVADPDAPREVRRWPAAADWYGDIFAATSIGPTLVVDAAGVPFLVTRDTVGYYKLYAVEGATGGSGSRAEHVLTGRPSAAVLAGPHVVVVNTNGDVRVLDTRALAPGNSPAAQVGTLATLGIVTMLEVREDRPDGLLYTGGNGAGMSVLDLAQPLDPRVIGRYAEGAPTGLLAVSGGIAVWGREGNTVQPQPSLDVLDMTDPRSPRRRTSYLGGRFGRIAVAPEATWLIHGHFMGAADQPPLAFSRADSPAAINESELPLDIRIHDGATVSGRLVSVGTYPPTATACTSNRLVLWDVPDARGPARRVGHLDVSPCGGEARTLRVTAAGDVAFVTQVVDLPPWPAVGRSQLSVVSVRDPQRPRVLARLPVSNTVGDLIEHRGYLFATVGWGGAFNRANITIIDVRRPAAPRVVGSLPDFDGAVAVVDERVFVSNGVSGVLVFEPPIDWTPVPPPNSRIALPWLGADGILDAP